MKDALVGISIIAYGRDPSPSMFNALADREDGKVPQAVDVTSGGGTINIVVQKASERSDAKEPVDQ